MPMPCSHCGGVVPAGVSYCPSCGSKQGSSSSGPPSGAHGITPLRPGQLVGGRYRVLAPIATGAMGSVWRGCDDHLSGRACAIKTVLVNGATVQERRERTAWFKREAEILASLDHPAICAIRDFVIESGCHYLILDFIEGHTLAQELELALRANPGLPQREVLAWAAQLCDALHYLHSRPVPIIFRDLKPQNVILRPDGRVTLIDFGIARPMVSTGGTAIGTGGYAPPEQYHGQAEVRSDVYGLAATLHHLLTGWDPTQHAPFTFPPIRSLVPTLSTSLEATLAQALHLVVSQRFSSVQAFADALAQAARELDGDTKGTSRPTATANGASARGPSAQPNTTSANYHTLLVGMRDDAQLKSELRPLVLALVQARVRHPGTPKLKVSFDLPAPVLRPWMLAHYKVNASFSTSVGVIHEERDSGTIGIDAYSGAPIKNEEAAAFLEACLGQRGGLRTVDDKQERASRPRGVYPAALPIDDLIVHLQEAVATKHTRTVEYRGANNQQYTKTCRPLTRDITVFTPSLLRVKTLQVAIHLGGQAYTAIYADTPSNTTSLHLLTTDLSQTIPICQLCGDVDDRDMACVVCARYVCGRCQRGVDNTYCSAECAEQAREAAVQYKRQQELAVHISWTSRWRRVCAFVTLMGFFAISSLALHYGQLSGSTVHIRLILGVLFLISGGIPAHRLGRTQRRYEQERIQLGRQ